jgi:hypothetical protein
VTDEAQDLNTSLMLDGNSVAGLLAEAFGREMTEVPCRCAHCGATGAMGTLLAFTQSPGVVLRCPHCVEVVLRMVSTDTVIYLEARGATFIRLPRPAAAEASF